MKSLDDTLELKIGTAAYIAPEVKFCEQPYNPFFADVYSFGCIVCDFEFGFGKRIAGEKKRKKNKVEEEIKEKSFIHSELIEPCLQETSNNRPSFKKIKNIIKERISKTKKRNLKKSI